MRFEGPHISSSLSIINLTDSQGLLKRLWSAKLTKHTFVTRRTSFSITNVMKSSSGNVQLTWSMLDSVQWCRRTKGLIYSRWEVANPEASAILRNMKYTSSRVTWSPKWHDLILKLLSDTTSIGWCQRGRLTSLIIKQDTQREDFAVSRVGCCQNWERVAGTGNREAEISVWERVLYGNPYNNLRMAGKRSSRSSATNA